MKLEKKKYEIPDIEYMVIDCENIIACSDCFGDHEIGGITSKSDSFSKNNYKRNWDREMFESNQIKQKLR